jgi:hypothetical protein
MVGDVQNDRHEIDEMIKCPSQLNKSVKKKLFYLRGFA